MQQQQDQERPYTVAFRVTEQERAIIRRTAKSMNRTPSDLCRLAVMGILEQMRTGRRLAPSAPGGRQDDQA